MSTRTLPLLLVLCLLLPSACRTTRPDGSVGPLPVGATAPDFQAKTADGKPVRLSDGQGHPRVVYFYPKDETPGCTKEACAFRDAWDRYTARDVWVFGVSRDSEKSHEEFRKKHSLPFPLAADEDGNIQKAYGVPNAFPGIAARMTFLVGPDGKIVHVWTDVDPAIHADEVLGRVK